MSYQEKDRRPKTVTLIERLRAYHPDQHILTVAVQLDNPSAMRDFLFQYADEIRRDSHSLESIKQHPLDAAAARIRRTANYFDRDTANRWKELLETGTLQNPIDHSMDWYTLPKALIKSPEEELVEIKKENARLKREVRGKNREIPVQKDSLIKNKPKPSRSQGASITTKNSVIPNSR